MSEEYRKIQEFFSMNAQEKSKHLKEILEKSIEFFQKFQRVLAEGSPEEKKAMMDEMESFRKQVMSQTESLAKSVGVSQEDLEKYAENPSNFTTEQWEALQSAKKKIQEQYQEISHAQEKEGGSKKPPDKTTPKFPKKWIQG
ncbi:MAG: hypothetical protein ACRCSV_04865 [Chlamydiales bacterium]